MGLRHVAENEPPGLGLLAPGTGVDGGWRLCGLAVAGAVGEAAILAAEGGGAAALALAVEELALAGFAWVGVVAITEGLTRESAAGAGLALVERGAEAWHRFPPEKGLGEKGQATIEKPRAASEAIAVSDSGEQGEISFITPYYQNTKLSLKIGQK